MKASIQEALQGHRSGLAWAKVAAVLVAVLTSAGPLGAQQVTRVFPLYAVAGQEVHFTVEGTRFPPGSSAALGMKHSFAKPAQCANARRDKPATATRYYFSCQLQSDASIARLSILHKPKASAAVKLWEGRVQVLSAAPRIDTLTLVGQLGSGRTTVTCNSSRTCLTVVGELVAGQAVVIDLTGTNLPFSLQLGFGGCRPRPGADDLGNTTTRRYNCTPQTLGDQAIHVLSAAQDEGGAALLSGQVEVLAAPSTPVTK